jgi:hypothetical protein
MALSDLVLGSGEVVVILSDSTLGIVPDGVALNFGTVQLVNQLSDKTTVGQSVWFDIKNATPFQVISGQTFYKVQEQYITASEPPLS